MTCGTGGYPAKGLDLPGLLCRARECLSSDGRGMARGEGLLLPLEVQTGLLHAPRTGPFPVLCCQSPGRTRPVGLSPCFSTPSPGLLDSSFIPHASVSSKNKDWSDSCQALVSQ